MPIDLQKLTPLDFCVLVLWLHGSSIGKIHSQIGKTLGKSDAAIRGIVNKKMKLTRSEMTIGQRQGMLDKMLLNRLDEGRIPEKFFTAVDLTKKASSVKPLSQYRKPKPAPPVFEPTRKGRAAKKAHAMAEKKRIVEAELLRLKSKNGLNESRGTNATAFEFLISKGLMADPMEKERGSITKTSSEMRRSEAGVFFRQVMRDVQFSQLKSQDFESVGGGGGMGVAIPARVVEGTSILRALKAMMTLEDMMTLQNVVVFDEFVWLKMKSKISMEICLEDIRRALDTVSVFRQLYPVQAFEKRWGFAPSQPTEVKSRSQARRETEAVKDMIYKAQKDLR